MRRMWPAGVVLLGLGIGAPIALVVWILVGRDDLVDLALDDRFLRAIAITAALALFARVVAVIEVTIVRRRDRNVGLAAVVAYVMVALLALPVGWSVVRAEPLDKLRAAEAAEVEQAAVPPELSPEDKLRRQLDESKYLDRD